MPDSAGVMIKDRSRMMRGWPLGSAAVAIPAAAWQMTAKTAGETVR